MAEWKLERQAQNPVPLPVEEVKAVYNPSTGVTSNFFSGHGRPEGDGEGR